LKETFKVLITEKKPEIIIRILDKEVTGQVLHERAQKLHVFSEHTAVFFNLRYVERDSQKEPPVGFLREKHLVDLEYPFPAILIYTVIQVI